MPLRPPVLDHLRTLSDDVGIIQHALEDVPNRSTGYCTDDVARAFIVAIAAHAHTDDPAIPDRLASTYLAFLHDAQMPDGRFHNFMGYDRNWQDRCGTEDSFGRAFWALGFGMRYAPRESWRRVCRRLAERALPNIAALVHLRAQAYAGLGLVQADAALGGESAAVRSAMRHVLDQLLAAYRAHARAEWVWFEEVMTYDNGRLPEAVMRLGAALGDDDAVEAGLATLTFLEATTIEQGRLFVPIGNAGWYPRGGVRSRDGQQPLEAAAMVDAGLVAEELSGDRRWRRLAEIAADWYQGRNTYGALMVTGGGCRDGIDPHGPSANMGAESTLAYLASAYAMLEREQNLRGRRGVRVERRA